MSAKRCWKLKEKIHQPQIVIESNKAAKEKLVYALFVK
jgi:hypothetical protein